LSDTNYNTENEILQDLKNGKVKPWRQKKVRSLILADSFKRLGYDKKSMRCRFCGSTLVFRPLETGEKKLQAADFCRERLCPMCQWRRSLKVFHQVSRVMDVAQIRHKEYVPIFLTLSVKNCFANELSSTLDEIFKGWYQLTKHRKIKRIVKGWFRALEVTYDGDKIITEWRYNKRREEYERKGVLPGDKNPNHDTFHPHIHTILLVEKSYFKGKDYMQTAEWVQMWRTAMGLDYDPICDIRAVKNGKGKRKAVAEIAKYTLKDSEFLTKDNDLTDKLVEVLGNSLRNRRLYAFGGVLKQLAKELDAEEPDKGDLIHIDDEKFREDVATVLEVYRWNFGLANYIKH
jgi:plasmid rolling circle replication initiator protein Rep